MNQRGEFSLKNIVWFLIILIGVGSYYTTNTSGTIALVFGEIQAQIIGTGAFLFAVYLLVKKPSPAFSFSEELQG